MLVILFNMRQSETPSWFRTSPARQLFQLPQESKDFSVLLRQPVQPIPLRRRVRSMSCPLTLASRISAILMSQLHGTHNPNTTRSSVSVFFSKTLRLLLLERTPSWHLTRQTMDVQ